jgi:hypothetical protein
MGDWLMATPGWLACVILIYDKLASRYAWTPYNLCRHWAKQKQCDMCKNEPKWKGDRWS